MKQLSKQGSSITQNNTENQQTELQIKLYAKEINNNKKQMHVQMKTY